MASYQEGGADALQLMLDTGRAISAQMLDAPDGTKLVITPNNYTVHRHAPLWPKLERIKRHQTFQNTMSLVDYVNEFKTKATRLYANGKELRVLAVIDHDAPDAPDYAVHTAELRSELSETWARWKGVFNKSLGQRELAEFLEENQVDVTAPTGAALLEICTNLDIQKAVTFKSGIRLQNGMTQLTFHETEAGNGAVQVPQRFSLGLPVFEGGNLYPLEVFLRYRLDEGKIIFRLVPVRLEYVFKTAFEGEVKAIAEATQLPVYIGSFDRGGITHR